MTVMQRVIKPRNRRSKRALERKEPLDIENTKQCLFLYGQKTSDDIRQCLKDLFAIKRQQSTFLQKKNPILPFEDILPLERFSQKHDASLFAMATHSKKRPNNLVMGRMFDHHILDIVELGVENFKGLSEFKNTKIASGTKPCMVFCGTDFEDVMELRRLKNLFIDFFRGVEATEVRLQGFEHALLFTSFNGTVMFRSYKIILKNSGTRIPLVELEEIGPSMDLRLRRSNFASLDLMKRACLRPKKLMAKKVKNIKRDVFGTKLGRVHMTKQDIGKLQTRKMKALRKNKDKNESKSDGVKVSSVEPMEATEGS